jgi:3D (Asp-Asp-Asp) domain-containing protein
VALSRSICLPALAGLLLLLTTFPAASAEGKPIKRERWLSGVLLTEYFPAPESWFVGKRVQAFGLAGRHRVDWLYSGTGMSMEGDGVGLDGGRFHIDGLGSQGWVNADGKRTRPSGGAWSAGSPYWRAVGWRNRNGRVTYPLEQGGWSRGRGVRYIRPRGITFASGPSRPLHYYRSIAVDPSLIPLGSRVYIPAYRKTDDRGWFEAADVGGAIAGHHVDVYRPPPPQPGGGNSTPNQRIYVVPPKR